VGPAIRLGGRQSESPHRPQRRETSCKTFCQITPNSAPTAMAAGSSTVIKSGSSAKSATNTPGRLSFSGAFDSSFMVTVRLIAPFLSGLLRPGGRVGVAACPRLAREISELGRPLACCHLVIGLSVHFAGEARHQLPRRSRERIDGEQTAITKCAAGGNQGRWRFPLALLVNLLAPIAWHFQRGPFW
jgi:hypothetical protein